MYEQTKYALKQKINELFADDCSGHDYWHSLRDKRYRVRIVSRYK